MTARAFVAGEFAGGLGTTDWAFVCQRFSTSSRHTKKIKIRASCKFPFPPLNSYIGFFSLSTFDNHHCVLIMSFKNTWIVFFSLYRTCFSSSHTWFILTLQSLSWLTVQCFVMGGSVLILKPCRPHGLLCLAGSGKSSTSRQQKTLIFNVKLLNLFFLRNEDCSEVIPIHDSET